jgi:hypothetical protein
MLNQGNGDNHTPQNFHERTNDISGKALSDRDNRRAIRIDHGVTGPRAIEFLSAVPRLGTKSPWTKRLARFVDKVGLKASMCLIFLPTLIEARQIETSVFLIAPQLPIISE